MSPKKKHKI